MKIINTINNRYNIQTTNKIEISPNKQVDAFINNNELYHKNELNRIDCPYKLKKNHERSESNEMKSHREISCFNFKISFLFFLR